MPTKQPRKRVEAPGPVQAASDNDYRKLIAFLDLASGFNLAVARCNLPSLREQIITSATKDAEEFGIAVHTVALPSDSSLDFVGAIRERLGPNDHHDRIALMVTGIDQLIYKSNKPDNVRNLLSHVRPAFVAQLNFDRDRIARDLPYPIVLWLDSETLSVLLKEAPDLRQWISARFEFGSTVAEHYVFSRLEEKPIGSKTAGEIQGDLVNLGGLLAELEETQGADDNLTLGKRCYLLMALAERYFRLARFEDATGSWTEALTIAERLKDRRAEAAILLHLGTTYGKLGNHRGAIQQAEKADSIARQIGDLNAQGDALVLLGAAYERLGEIGSAIKSYDKARDIARELKNRRLEMNTLNGLASAFLVTSNFSRALHFYEQALAVARELQDRYGEAMVLGNLGIVFANLGNLGGATGHFESSLQAHRAVGDKHGEATALNNLAVVYKDRGEYHRSIGFAKAALEMFRKMGDRNGEAQALGSLGDAYRFLRDFSPAIWHHEKALQINLEIGNRKGYAMALGSIGADYVLRGERSRGLEYLKKQLDVEREIGDRSGEANALWNIAVALHDLHQHPGAVAKAEEALGILDSMAHPKAAELRNTLTQWRARQ